MKELLALIKTEVFCGICKTHGKEEALPSLIVRGSSSAQAERALEMRERVLEYENTPVILSRESSECTDVTTECVPKGILPHKTHFVRQRCKQESRNTEEKEILNKQKSTQSKDCLIYKLFGMTCGGKEILRAGALRMTGAMDDEKLDCFAFARNDALLPSPLEGYKGNRRTLCESCDPVCQCAEGCFPVAASLKPGKQGEGFIEQSLTRISNIRQSLMLKFYPLTKREGNNKVKNLTSLNNVTAISRITFHVSQKKRANRKAAFTLAEVLVTLGIIGVVVVITLPSVVNKTRQKEWETAFQKQYSMLQQAIMRQKLETNLEFTTENYGVNQYYSENSFMRLLAKQYKVIKDCGFINNSNGCVLLNEDRSFDYYKSYTNGTLSKGWFDDGGFITSDGTTFFVEQGTQSVTTGYLVSIDVNGYKKGPNRMGYDFFTFAITKDGKVLPMGADNTAFVNQRDVYCSNSSSSDMNGYTCAYFALTDKDYFKNLR